MFAVVYNPSHRRFHIRTVRVAEGETNAHRVKYRCGESGCSLHVTMSEANAEKKRRTEELLASGELEKPPFRLKGGLNIARIIWDVNEAYEDFRKFPHKERTAYEILFPYRMLRETLSLWTTERYAKLHPDAQKQVDKLRRERKNGD